MGRRSDDWSWDVPVCPREGAWKRHKGAFDLAGTRTRNAGETQDIPVDWSERLGTETISASSWTSDSVDVSVVTSEFTDTATVVRVSGGIAGQEYYLQNTVTTANGQTLYGFVKVVVETDLVP